MENIVAIVCTAALIVCILYVTGKLSFKSKDASTGGAPPQQQPQHPQQQAPPLSMIEVFVSSECHHCVSFKPEIDKLEQLAKAAGISYRLVIPTDPDVNIMMQTRNVQYFPLVLLKGQPFQGERTAAAIMTALQEVK